VLKKLYNNRNKISIIRDKGGLGDIFMHRMIFEDFKKVMPECHLSITCPKKYHEALIDHPFLDEITEEIKDYGISFNTSFICNRYEMKKAPFIDKHRSDIWANHCGIELTNHEMHFQLTEEEKQWGKDRITSNKKIVILAPISAMMGKNLDHFQINSLLNKLEDFSVFILHTKEIIGVKAKYLTDCSIRQFMSVIYASDYVISVDTAAFHCAGGLKKPTLGIFSFMDGKVYGKYYHTAKIIQKHRDNGDWDCGPCFDFSKCPKCPEMTKPRKPCITELTGNKIFEEFTNLVDASDSFTKSSD
jgi:ADP-heptose:LPS heptosyltransferase